MSHHIISVDLEDWPQSCVNQSLSITNSVVRNTEIILDLFDQYSIKATFFCLGLVAEKYPGLIRRVHSKGHEIGTHGWSHRSVKKLGPSKFKSELDRSVKLLQDVCGKQVRGHRAPDFSIDLSMTWAFDIIREIGLEYDSSIFPIKGSRYGSPESPVYPYRFQSGLWEIPLTTVDVVNRRIPVLGGGYFRLFPYHLSRAFLKKIQAEKRIAVIYLHPYEINPRELKEYDISRKMRFHQGLFRSRVALRLKRLFSEFKFTTAQKYIENMAMVSSVHDRDYAYLMIQNPAFT